MSSTNGSSRSPLDDSRDLRSSVLVDGAVASLLMPWACPCPFGPHGRYRLEELVGAGRSSLVYRATDTHMSSEGFPAAVAIKIGRRGETSSAEALTGRRISHPNVLRVLDRGEDPSGCAYIVTEYLQGGDLEAKPGPWERRAAVAFMAKLARGVHAAHSAGVVHCDLKPANILLSSEGEPKLADFDLARSAVSDSNASRGNVAFMSPEQFAGEPDSLTPPSDVYALGGLLYHLLTGKLPNGDTAEMVGDAHTRGLPPPAPGLDPDLDRICQRALTRRREDRYESAAALAGDLERWQRFEPLPWGRTKLSRRVSLWCRSRPYQAVSVLAMVLLLGAAAFFAVVMARNYQHDRKVQMDAQAESIRKTQEQVKQIQTRVQAHVRTIFGVIAGQDNLRDQILPSLVWLQWISDVPILGNEGRAIVASERIAALQTLVANAEVQGRGKDFDTRLARLALVHFLLMEAQTPAANDQLAKIEADWAGLLRPDDPIQLSIKAMHACIAAELDSNRPISYRASELDRVEGQLRAAGSAEPARRLVGRVRERLLSSTAKPQPPR